MKTFTSGFNTEKNKKTGPAPVWILRCPFSVSGTLHLSDQQVTIAGWFGGVTTLPWVSNWGSIDENIAGDGFGVTVADFSLQVINDPNSNVKIEDVLWMGSNNIEMVDCELYLWFRGLNPATDPPVKMWVGNIVDFEKVDELNYSLTLVDQSVRVDKYIGEKVTLDEYPGADPDEVGKVKPIIYGAVTRTPCLALDAGSVTMLKSNIDATVTTIPVSDTTGFAAGMTIQIDEEQLIIGSIGTEQFTGCTRHANATVAAKHQKGALGWEKQTTFVFMWADHPVKSISKVWAKFGGDDRRRFLDITAECATYTGQPGYELVGYPGKAMITISDLAAIRKKAENWLADDNIEVAAEGSSYGVTPTGGLGDDWTEDGNSIDGSQSTYASLLGDYGVTYNVDFTWPSTSHGPIDTQYAYYTFEDQRTLGNGTVVPTNSGWSPASIALTGIKETIMFQKTGGSWSDDPGLDLTYNSARRMGDVTKLYEVVKNVVTTDNNVIKSGGAYNTGLSLVDTVLPNGICANGEGYQDNAYGTFTGGSYVLITRPDHVFRHFLYTYLGWPTANFLLVNDAGTNFGTTYKLAGVINEYRKAKEWLNYWAFQCRCRFRFYAGKAYLQWRPDGLSANKTLTPSVIRGGAVKMSRSPLDEVINKIVIHYDRDWTQAGGDGAYRPVDLVEAEINGGRSRQKVALAQNSVSAGRYGVRERPELFNFDFVTSAAMAMAVRDFYLARYKDRKRVFSFELFLDNSELELGDVITSDSPAIEYLLLETGDHLLLETGDDLLINPRPPFAISEIEKVNFQPGSGMKNVIDTIGIISREY